MPSRNNRRETMSQVCEHCNTQIRKGWKVCKACGKVPDNALYDQTYRPVYEYELNPGKNKFFCGGRIMTANDLRLAKLTWFLLFLITTLFFIFDAPYLWTEVHPAIPIIAGVLTYFSIANLIAVSWSDPGVIPRGSEAEVITADPFYPVPMIRTVKIGDHSVRTKYCVTCKMYRPPRTSHCSRCDSCIEGFDHHCPWVGNCVGRNNYRYFLSFITAMALLCLFISAASAAHLVLLAGHDGHDFARALRLTPTSAVCVVFGVAFFIVIGRLWVYHAYLVSVGLSTNEELNRVYNHDHSPNIHDRGCKLNLVDRCCSPQNPSRLHHRRRLNKDGAQHNRPFLPLKPLKPPIRAVASLPLPTATPYAVPRIAAARATSSPDAPFLAVYENAVDIDVDMDVDMVVPVKPIGKSDSMANLADIVDSGTRLRRSSTVSSSSTDWGRGGDGNGGTGGGGGGFDENSRALNSPMPPRGGLPRAPSPPTVPTAPTAAPTLSAAGSPTPGEEAPLLGGLGVGVSTNRGVRGEAIELLPLPAGPFSRSESAASLTVGSAADGGQTTDRIVKTSYGQRRTSRTAML